jgi:hypothetical protein
MTRSALILCLSIKGSDLRSVYRSSIFGWTDNNAFPSLHIKVPPEFVLHVFCTQLGQQRLSNVRGISRWSTIRSVFRSRCPVSDQCMRFCEIFVENKSLLISTCNCTISGAKLTADNRNRWLVVPNTGDLLLESVKPVQGQPPTSLVPADQTWAQHYMVSKTREECSTTFFMRKEEC